MEVKPTNNNSKGESKSKYGIVFLDTEFNDIKNKKNEQVVQINKAGAFTYDARVESFGEQEIGTVEKNRIIIDDMMKGFRIKTKGKRKEVKEMDKDSIAKTIQKREELGKEVNENINKSDIKLVKQKTGYDLVLQDKTKIIDDSNKER